MESSNGYNTNALIDPIDFYNVIINNIDKFSNNDRFIILRFFDKLTDSIGFSSLCKSRLRYHISRKDIKSKAEMIFNMKSGVAKIEILKDVAYLYRSKDNQSWEFKLGDTVILNELSGNEALKIVKDVNNAFLIKSDKGI